LFASQQLSLFDLLLADLLSPSAGNTAEDVDSMPVTAGVELLASAQQLEQSGGLIPNSHLHVHLSDHQAPQVLPICRIVAITATNAVANQLNGNLQVCECRAGRLQCSSYLLR
jgi:hypothetical protein